MVVVVVEGRGIVLVGGGNISSGSGYGDCGDGGVEGGELISPFSAHVL